jgi:RNA polymerase sigma factor (sigma-70 family)
MEPPVRLYSPNGSGSPRKRRGRPARVTDDLEAEPASAPVPATKPAKRGRAPKRGRATTGQAPTPPTGELPHPAEAIPPPPAALVEAVPVSGLLDDHAKEWAATAAEEAGPAVGIEDFEDIFSRFQTPLTNFVYRLVGNREQAYDLTQDVFVKAYRALSTGTTIQAAALSSWLYRIASNTATDALRRRRLISWLPLSLFNEDRGVGAGIPGSDGAGSQQQTFAEENLPSSATAFASSYDGGRFEQRVADREIVQSILQRLPPKYATCLLLYEHEGFSCAEIAEVLNVTPSAVKMRLMRARERFITLYKQETGA